MSRAYVFMPIKMCGSATGCQKYLLETIIIPFMMCPKLHAPGEAPIVYLEIQTPISQRALSPDMFLIVEISHKEASRN